MNNQVKLIDADKLMKWLKIREEEAYANAAQTLSPSFFKGKAEGFNDVADYLNSGHFDPDTPLVPTIKPGDRVRHDNHGEGGVRSIEGTDVWVFFDKYDYDLLVSVWNLEVVE